LPFQVAGNTLSEENAEKHRWIVRQSFLRGWPERILFMAGDGRRMTVRLGKANMRQAKAFKVRVESLITGRFIGNIDPETVR